MERHALGDDEIGELVDAVDDEEEREEPTPKAKGGTSSFARRSGRGVATIVRSLYDSAMREAWAALVRARVRSAAAAAGGATDRLSRVEALRRRPRHDGARRPPRT